MEKRTLSGAAGLALLGVAMVHAVREVARAPHWSADDAYVVVRYAEHLVRHGVFAYNVGGERVEGITSPLFALIAVLASVIRLDPIWAMKAVGIAAYWASGPLVFALAKALRAPSVAAGVLTLSYLAIPEHTTLATCGLETEAFIAAELAAVLLFVRAWNAPRPARQHGLLAVCSIVSLLRPEGHAVMLVLLGAFAFRVRGRERRDFLRAAFFVCVVPLALVALARWVYFGSLVPNTYFAKHRAIGTDTLRDVVFLTRDYLADLAALALALLLVARLLGAPGGRVAPSVRVLLVASGLMLGALSLAYAGKDVANFSRRFAMHELPWLLVPLILLGVRAVSRVARLRRPRLRLVTELVLGILVIAFGVVAFPLYWVRWSLEQQAMNDRMRSRVELYEPAAASLVEYARGKAEVPTLAVYPDGGYVPYRTNLPTIDFGRLNDRYLARATTKHQDVVEYFYAKAPDAVMFSHYGPDRLWNREAREIMQDPRFAGYELLKAWIDTRKIGLSVWVRRAQPQSGQPAADRRHDGR